MKVDVQVSHPDNSARDTTEIEKDSRRVQEMPGTMARISPLRRASLEFMTPLKFKTPDGADYFLPRRRRRGRVIALCANRIWRRIHQIHGYTALNRKARAKKARAFSLKCNHR